MRLPDFQCDADSGLEPTLASKSEILSRGCAKMSDALLHGKVLTTKPYTLILFPKPYTLCQKPSTLSLKPKLRGKVIAWCCTGPPASHQRKLAAGWHWGSQSAPFMVCRAYNIPVYRGLRGLGFMVV